MPFDPGDVINTVERTIGIVPAAGLAIIMLVGPTVIWLIWRLIVQPRTNRFAERGVDLLWICERCRSANEVRVSRCYSCGFDRESMSGDLHILDGDGVVVLASDGSATVRSPGAATAAAAVPSGAATALGTRPPDGPLAPARAAPPHQMVAVGPGRPETEPATPGVPVGSAAASEPAGEPATLDTPPTSRTRRPPKAAVTVPPTVPPEA